MDTRTVVINNISCNHCVHTIEREIGEIKGVQTVKADLPTKIVTIIWEGPATWDQIAGTLTEIEYPPSELKQP